MRAILRLCFLWGRIDKITVSPDRYSSYPDSPDILYEGWPWPVYDAIQSENQINRNNWEFEHVNTDNFLSTY